MAEKTNADSCTGSFYWCELQLTAAGFSGSSLPLVPWATVNCR